MAALAAVIASAGAAAWLWRLHSKPQSIAILQKRAQRIEEGLLDSEAALRAKHLTEMERTRTADLTPRHWEVPGILAARAEAQPPPEQVSGMEAPGVRYLERGAHEGGAR